MDASRREAIAAYRRRLKRRGIARVQVRVPQEDADLLHDVAAALSDPERGEEMRTLLRRHLEMGRAHGLKALLAQAPLEGIALTRDVDR